MTNQVSREVAVRAVMIATEAYDTFRRQYETGSESEASRGYTDSAFVGLTDAIAQLESGNYRAAQRRAMSSIAYSRGMMSDEYRAAASVEV